MKLHSCSIRPEDVHEGGLTLFLKYQGKQLVVWEGRYRL